MTETVREKYNVVDTFKSTNAQEIYIGTAKTEEGTPVIINVVKDLTYLDLIEEDSFKKAMTNLVYFEKSEESLVLVTRVLEAESLLVHMEENYVSMKSRMDYAFQYLREIVKYEGFPPAIQHILLDGAQLVVQGDKLSVDELLIFSDEVSSEKPLHIGAQVASVLNKIIFFDYPTLQREELMLAEVQQFLVMLEQQEESFNLQEIYQTFRKLYIYHYCMEGIDDPDQPGETLQLQSKPRMKLKIKSSAQVLPEENQRPEKKKWYVGAVLVLLLGATVFGLSQLIPETAPAAVDQPEEEPEALVAAFQVNEQENTWEFINESTSDEENPIQEYLWEIIYDDQVVQSAVSKDLVLSFNREGEYEISLKVKGTDGAWSEPHIELLSVKAAEEPEEGDIVEDYQLFQLSTVGQNNIIKDESLHYSEDYSFKLINDKDLIPAFTLTVIEPAQYASLSFLVKTTAPEELTMVLMVYNEGKLVHREEMNQSVSPQDDWKLVYFNLPEEIIEEAKVELTAFSDTIWVDAIALDSLK